MSVKHRVRIALQRVGLDISRYPEGRQGHITVGLLAECGADLVVDIGANDGGFGRELRSFGYNGRIVSVEALAEPYSRLVAHIASDPAWTAVHTALGSVDESLEMGVASNGEASSSLLPMLESHASAAPGSVYRGTEQVRVRRLEEVWPEIAAGSTRPFLKLDVQGYEGHVLDGAGEALLNAAVGIQLELSMVPLYAGGLSDLQAMERMAAAGFRLAQFFPGLRDAASGYLLQADAVFVRSTS